MSAPSRRIPGAQARSTAIASVFVAQALSTGATTIGIALSSLVIVHLSGSESLSGVPSTVKQVASALAALIVGQLMARAGRRLGLSLSYLVAALGALIGGYAALQGSLWGFLLGVTLVGLGDGGISQGRYAVAELVPAAYRGRIVGYLLSFGVLGSVLSTAFTPLLQTLARDYRVSSLELGWILGGVFLLLGMGILAQLLRAQPLEPPTKTTNTSLEQSPGRNPWAVPGVRLALIALSVGQGVMVMLMVLTPLHAQHLGHGLPTISSLISAHLAGMFGLAWLTGNLVDRYGERRFIALGSLTLASSALLAIFATSAFWIGVSLFLLGLGWNWCYVAGSSLLTGSLNPLERSTVQGQTEFAVWGAAALGSLLGGLIVGQFGFGVLGLIGAGVSLLPLLALLRWRGARAEAALGR